MRRIIGFAGRKRSGKSIASDYLVKNYGYHRVAVADQLKKLCANLLNIDLKTLNQIKDDGTTFFIKPDEIWEDKIHQCTGIDKEIIHNSLKNMVFTNMRDILQYIGTNLIREYYPNWHVDETRKLINSFPDSVIVVVEDVRFPNERKMIEELFGEVFFIMRPSEIKGISNHASETSLRWQDFDDEHIIVNDSTQHYLFNLVGNLAEYKDVSEIKRKYSYPKTSFPLNNNDIIFVEDSSLTCDDGMIGTYNFNGSEELCTELLNRYGDLFNTNRGIKNMLYTNNHYIIENAKLVVKS